MIAGHYATALIAHQRLPKAPVWLFLLSSNVPDFLWLILAIVGPERPQPESILDASFANIHVDMHFSHDLVSVVVLAGMMGIAGFLASREMRVATWCAGLVVLHGACDFVSGFQHNLLGRDTMALGLNLYRRAPEVALLIEAAAGAVVVTWFKFARASSGRPLSHRSILSLYAVLVGGTLIWLPTARTSLSTLMYGR